MYSDFYPQIIAANKGRMTMQTTGTQTHTQSIHASDIKNLVRRQGKAIIGDQEFTLKDPAATDPKLQSIVNDPTLSVKPINTATANGQCEYELSANGKTVKIKVDCKTTR